MTGNANRGLAVIRTLANDAGFQGKFLISGDDQRWMREFLAQYDEVCRIIENLHDIPCYIRRLEDFTRRRG